MVNMVKKREAKVHFLKLIIFCFLKEFVTLGIRNSNEVYRNPLRLGRRFGEHREALRYVVSVRKHYQSQAELPGDAILIKSNSTDLETSGYFLQ